SAILSTVTSCSAIRISSEVELDRIARSASRDAPDHSGVNRREKLDASQFGELRSISRAAARIRPVRIFPIEITSRDDSAVFFNAAEIQLVILFHFEAFIEPRPTVVNDPHKRRGYI